MMLWWLVRLGGKLLVDEKKGESGRRSEALLWAKPTPRLAYNRDLIAAEPSAWPEKHLRHDEVPLEECGG